MILEVNLGISLRGDAQQQALDEGYTLEPYEGHFRNRYVMGVRHLCGKHGKFDRIVANAENIFGIDRKRLLGRSHARADVRPRQAVMWVLMQIGWSSPMVGRRMDRDHSTVLDGRNRCQAIQERDMGYRRACERLLESVR